MGVVALVVVGQGFAVGWCWLVGGACLLCVVGGGWVGGWRGAGWGEG